MPQIQWIEIDSQTQTKRRTCSTRSTHGSTPISVYFLYVVQSGQRMLVGCRCRKWMDSTCPRKNLHEMPWMCPKSIHEKVKAPWCGWPCDGTISDTAPDRQRFTLSKSCPRTFSMCIKVQNTNLLSCRFPTQTTYPLIGWSEQWFDWANHSAPPQLSLPRTVWGELVLPWLFPFLRFLEFTVTGANWASFYFWKKFLLKTLFSHSNLMFTFEVQQQVVAPDLQSRVYVYFYFYLYKDETTDESNIRVDSLVVVVWEVMSESNVCTIVRLYGSQQIPVGDGAH